MFEIIICFFVATVISFAGSLQLGSVNLNVIHTAINKGFRESIYVAIGGCIPEMIYCSIAFCGAELIVIHSSWLNYFKWISVFVFLTFGIFTLIKRQSPIKQPKNQSVSFFSGFMLGILNPLLVTFWLSIISYLKQFNLGLDNFYSKMAFVIGSAIGAFLLLLTFSIIVTKNKLGFIQRQQHKINNLLGIIFITLAFIQFIELIVGK